MGSMAIAGEADVIAAQTDCAEHMCTFSVTVAHGDSGWDHYADHWRIVTPGDGEIGRRVLYHPHVEEQPFTRNLGPIAVPPGIDRVVIQAHDSVHGYGGKVIETDLQ